MLDSESLPRGARRSLPSVKTPPPTYVSPKTTWIDLANPFPTVTSRRFFSSPDRLRRVLALMHSLLPSLTQMSNPLRATSDPRVVAPSLRPIIPSHLGATTTRASSVNRRLCLRLSPAALTPPLSVLEASHFNSNLTSRVSSTGLPPSLLLAGRHHHARASV